MIAQYDTVPVTAADRRYFNILWNFLRDNVDLVEWLACLLEGPSKGECLRERLTSGETQVIHLEDPSTPRPCGQDCGAWSTLVGSDIHWVADRDWRDSRDLLLDAYDAGDTNGALCLTARLSGTLLHEMFHGCLGLTNESADDEFVRDDTCGCDTTDMIESSLLWALRRRYPCLEGMDCGGPDRGCLWMNPCDSYEDADGVTHEYAGFFFDGWTNHLMGCSDEA